MESMKKTNKLDRILTAEEELVPSSGFVASVMERVREEAAAPEPIPFPWKTGGAGCSGCSRWGGVDWRSSGPAGAGAHARSGFAL